MGDLNQTIIEKSIEHWPVFVGVALLGVAMWKYIIPNSVRLSLENGGGDAVRSVVKSELHSQDDRIDEKLAHFEEKSKDRLLEVITKHEEVERITIQNVLLKLKNEHDAERSELANRLSEFDERATHIERKLKMKRRVPVNVPGKR